MLQPPTKMPEPPEEDALGWIQQVVAPIDGSAERPLSLGEIARGAGQERQASLQTAEDRLRVEQLDPGSGQLDGQGQAIQPRADAGDRRRAEVVDLEVGAHGLCASDEERHRVVLGQGV